MSAQQGVYVTTGLQYETAFKPRQHIEPFAVIALCWTKTLKKPVKSLRLKSIHSINN